jgi:S-DNA-T family DNA segregation ATPase FtsK/SpoIIIE
MTNKPRFPGSGGSNRDDDEDKDRPVGGSRPSNLSNRPNPFGARPGDKKDDKPGAPKPSGGFGSRSSFGSKNDDDEDDDDLGPSRPSSPSRPGSTFGSKPPEKGPVSSVFGSKPGASSPSTGNKPGDPPKPSSPFGNRQGDPPKPASTFGSKPAGSSGSSYGSKPNDPPKPSPTFGSKPGDPPKPASTFGAKPGDPPKPGATSGSKPSGSGSAFGSKPPDKKDDKPAEKSGGPLGGLRSPFGQKPADKKDDKPAEKSGGPLGGLRSPFGQKPADKPGDKKDDKAADKGGGPLGGLRSPFGQKPADKPGDKKDDKAADKGGSPLGGLRSPFGQKPADKPGDKKDAKPGDKPAGPLGGVRLPFGQKPADKPGDKKDAKPGDKPAGGGLFGGRLPFGQKPADKPADKPGTTSSLAKPGESRPGGAVAAPPKAASTTAIDPKKTASKVPPARGEKVAKPLERPAKQVTVQQGLSLDQKLDIVGIGLILTGIVFFFSVANPGEGSFTKAIGNILGGLFGTAKYVLWLPPLATGLWLYIQRFNENPLVVKMHRIAGYVLILVTLATTLHFIDLLQKPVVDMATLIKVSDTVAREQGGGGWVGGEIYKFLMQALGEWATPVIVVAFWIVGIMLAGSITAGEVAIYVKSLFRWFARVTAGFREQRRVAAEARAAAAAAKAEQQRLQKPAPAGELAAGAASASLAAPVRQAGIPERTGTAETAAIAAPSSAGAPRLTPTAPPAPIGSKPADKRTSQTAKSPFGKAPAAVAVKEAEDEEEAEAETETENVPTAQVAVKDEKSAGRPAATAFGPRPTTTATPGVNKPAETKTDGGSSKSTPFGSRPTPFGSRPAPFNAVDEEDIDEEEDLDEEAAPIVKPSPVKPSPLRPGAANTPAKPSPFGAKPGTDKADVKAEKAEISDTAKTSEAPAASTPAAKLNPVGATTSSAQSSATAPNKLPEARAEVKSGDKPADKPADKADDKADVKPAEGGELKPATPMGSRPNPFGARPLGKPAESKTETKPEAKTSDKPAEKADEKADTGTLKPATPIGNRPSSPFGARPDSASRTPGSAFGKPTETKAEIKADAKPGNGKDLVDEDDDEDEKADAATLKPATPMGNRPSPFGAHPASSPLTRPAPKPGAAPARPPAADEDEEDIDDDTEYVDLDDVDDGEEDAQDAPKSTPTAVPSRPASPFASRSDSPTSKQPAADQSEKLTTTAAAPAQKLESPTEVVPARPPAPQTTSSMPLGKSPSTPSGSAPAAAPAAAQRPASPPATPAENKPPLEGVIVSSKKSQNGDKPDFRELLEPGSQQRITDEILEERKNVIEETLQAFGAPGRVVEIHTGPVITQFGVEPDYLVSRQGKKTRVKVSAIARLDADLALALAARSIRIEAPVPGKGYVGIEVPNAQTALVSLYDIMAAPEFEKINSKLRIALGQSVDGTPIAADLTQMPHLLIAGTTGSGKSVCVNAIIACLLLENSPDEMKMIMVDPKRVELTGYNGIPHLISPVVVDLERIVGVLKWVSREMDERYKKFSQAGARNLIDYNNRLGPSDPKLPYLVVVIDELADLMMLAPEETEKVITRLAQMARATGIHLIISTQRPSVDVVTGLIKANFPARISFAVASSVDSRVILDQPGAEKLLGRGDMLYQAPDAAAPLRMQGVFVSDPEINRITRFWKTARSGSEDSKTSSSSSIFDLGSKPGDANQSLSDRFGQRPLGGTPAAPAPAGSAPASTVVRTTAPSPNSEDDEMYDEAVDLVKKMNKASISLLQRRLRIGYTRAARLIDLMVQRGVISAPDDASQDADDDE